MNENNTMEVMVEGVRIELTPEQIATIKKEKSKRERSRRSFATILRQYGFKKISTKGWENPKQDCYEHEKYGWYADIINRGASQEVWMTGSGLKTSNGFPGGWTYSEPLNLEGELITAIDKKQKKHDF